MKYSDTTRVRDSDDQLVHVHEPGGHYRAICRRSFAASSSDILESPASLPTCLWCVANTIGELPHWRLAGREDPRELRRRLEAS